MTRTDLERATPFIGAWKLVSFELRGPGGEVSHLMGPEAKGMIIYHACGYMSAQIMKPDVPRFASGNQWLGTPEEIKAAFEGFVSYYGTYSFGEEQNVVVHHVEASLFPNWVGDDQRRFFEFSGNHLTLSTPPVTVGDQKWTGVLVWERIE
jgi:hypothetical protein